ncbi:CND2 protein, partial [Serilophus lunatus]|nr:CND2 protein [Serilophus lunatus]
QLAAGLLEASGKIYAMRVDRLYEDTYKVLGNLSLQSAPAKDVKNPGEGGKFL